MTTANPEPAARRVLLVIVLRSASHDSVGEFALHFRHSECASVESENKKRVHETLHVPESGMG